MLFLPVLVTDFLDVPTFKELLNCFNRIMVERVNYIHKFASLTTGAQRHVTSIWVTTTKQLTAAGSQRKR